MIEMFVTGIALDVRNNHPLVILNDSSKKRALPIWIGQAEAQAIARALEDFKPERPLTHDLIINLLKATGYKIKHIEINELNENTYFSTVVLENAIGELRPLDARPSDAIALSLRAECPIYISEKVFDDGTIPTELEEEDEDTEAFKNFVQNVKASDFKKASDEE
ncbi:MAG: bifunctional nuclease family protein [Candidatus Melainabacteria bacterium]|nr:bifunctional nuclease family protein [Candidatus Melainabacteria bacterium]MBI3309084.1 bifunctional nuclease family protein [Candidatus Melainabacteria bacterium]